MKKKSHCFTASAALEFCPGSPSDALVLDIGSGTGLVAEEVCNAITFMGLWEVNVMTKMIKTFFRGFLKMFLFLVF